MNIINYEKAEKTLREIEKIMEEYDIEERQLMLKLLGERMAKIIREQRVKDTVDTHPLVMMANKMMKKGGE